MGQVLSCDRCGKTMEAAKVIVRAPQTERKSGQQEDWDICKSCQDDIDMGITFADEVDEIGTRLNVPQLVMPELNPAAIDTTATESEKDNG